MRGSRSCNLLFLRLIWTDEGFRDSNSFRSGRMRLRSQPVPSLLHRTGTDQPQVPAPLLSRGGSDPLGCDQTILLTTRWPVVEYPDKPRHLRVHDTEEAKALNYLTNDFELPTLTVAFGSTENRILP